MPAYRIPRRSGPHRIAAIALFRALLAQCRRIDLDPVRHDELCSLIRNRFKQARHDQSTRRLKVSFEAGYEAVDLLDGAVAGNGESQSRILKLLEEDAPWKAKQPPPATRVASEKSRKDRSQLPSQTGEGSPAKRRPSLFDRPLPLSELSGRRHVPVLVSANQIPMLRIKKPQPESLTGYLNHRMKTRHKRHERRHRLGEELSIAEREDEWDYIVAEVGEGKRWNFQDSMTGELEPGWADAVEEGLQEVHQHLNEEREKNRDMAEKMQGVVDRETALYEKEKAERKQARPGMSLEGKHEEEGDGSSTARVP